MTSTLNNNVVERLRGRENYDTWCVAARSYLIIKGYWSVVTSEPAASESATVTAANIEKIDKALSEITLLIEPVCYTYIATKTTAKQAWDALKEAFADGGVCRRIVLLEQLVTTKLTDCSSMEDFVNKKTTLWTKVKSAGFAIDENVAASLMLAGLPNEFKPMVFGIERSTPKLTVDYVKNLLLQEMLFEPNEVGNALATKSKNYKQSNRKRVECFKCKGPHFLKKCPNREKGDDKTDYNKKKGGQNYSGNVLLTTFFANKPTDWYIDSGASSHMTNEKKLLRDLRCTTSADVLAANNEKMSVDGVGSVSQTIKVNGEDRNIMIENVRYIPKLCANLLSVSQIVLRDLEVVFNKNGCVVLDKQRNAVACGSLVNNLFKLDTVEMESACAVNNVSDSTALWHRRLGHVSLSNMNFISDHIKGDLKLKSDMKCITCIKGKQSRLPFKHTGERANELLALVHSDICGPMSVNSYGGARYYITFIDDFSRKVFVYIIMNKNQAVKCFVDFKNMSENQLNKKIKVLRTDNGLEYINSSFKSICEKSGIVHQKSCAYVHEQNGVAERMNRTIMERVRCMLFDADLEKRFWAEAVSTAAYLLNRTPCRSSKLKTPEEFWSGKQPDLSHLRVFGCIAMVHIPKERRKKLDAKSAQCIFVGYSDDSKGYRLFNKATGKIVTARDVVFIEDTTRLLGDTVPVTSSVELDDATSEKEFISENELDIEMNNSQEIDDSGRVDDEEPAIIEISDESLSQNGVSNNDTTFRTPENSLNEDSIRTPDDPNDATYVPGVIVSTPVNVDRVTRSRANTFNLMNANDAAAHYAFVMGEPTKFEEAIACSDSDEWKEAMNDEYGSLMQNKTWNLVDLPNGKRAIDNRWVYKVKLDQNGEIERFKARLVIRGFTQEYGINYFETFSPVVKFTSIRAILAVAAAKGMAIKQFDVKTAFLNSELEEEIYMKQPKGYNDESGRVCKLNKSLYGLKQASRCWNKKFTDFMVRYNFKVCNSDPCVFVHSGDKIKAYMTIHVDDGLIVSNDQEFINSVIEYLNSGFEIKAMEVNCYLGLQIEKRKDGSIFVHQRGYAKKLLERFDMLTCKKVAMPADPNQVLCKRDGDDRDTTYPYRQAVGSLMYLAVATRPDITFILGCVSRFLEKPSSIHVNAVKRIFRYISGTADHGILYNANNDLKLHGYSDADYAGDVDSRRSTSGYCFMLGSGIISWASERQKTVALSTTESEYIASAQAVKELTWLNELLKELLPHVNYIPNFYVDNQSAIRLIKNPEFHKRTKHIDIRYHFIRQKYEEKLFNLHYVETEKQLADGLTKSLGGQKFELFCRSIGMRK